MTWLKKSIKDEQRSMLRDHGYNVLEHEKIGQYDLVLTSTPFARMGITNKWQYQLGIQREGFEFTKIEDQQSKAPLPTTNSENAWKNFEQIKNTINQWKSKYPGDMLVKSHNDKKTKTYFNILTEIGLNPRWENVYGHQTIVI